MFNNKPMEAKLTYFGRSYPQIDIDEPFLEKAWQVCGQNGKPPTEFRDAIAEALRGYHWRRVSNHRMPSKDRRRIYAKIEKHAGLLRNLLLDLDDELVFYFSDTYTSHFEPENFIYEVIDTDFEGLSYFEAQADQLETMLDELSEGARLTSTIDKAFKGRPRLNSHLEQTILELGKAFRLAHGQAPMESYSYNELRGDRPYTGPFLDFLMCVLWGYAKQEIPSNSAIGEAARKAYGLRK